MLVVCFAAAAVPRPPGEAGVVASRVAAADGELTLVGANASFLEVATRRSGRPERADTGYLLELEQLLSSTEGAEGASTALIDSPADITTMERDGHPQALSLERRQVTPIADALTSCGQTFIDTAKSVDCEPQTIRVEENDIPIQIRPPLGESEGRGQNEFAAAMRSFMVDKTNNCKQGARFLYTLGCCECKVIANSNCHTQCPEGRRVLQVTKTDGLKVFPCNSDGTRGNVAIYHRDPRALATSFRPLHWLGGVGGTVPGLTKQSIVLGMRKMGMRVKIPGNDPKTLYVLCRDDSWRTGPLGLLGPALTNAGADPVSG